MHARRTGGEGFAVDASLIAADANKQRSVPGEEWGNREHGVDAGRAVREYLARLDDAAFGAVSRCRSCGHRAPAAIALTTRDGQARRRYLRPQAVSVRVPLAISPQSWSAVRCFAEPS